ncbi:glycosyltransferase family 4 protein [Oscillatoria sp. FACHB-1406]|uniref:glycosyltransferase family 4 protein n=1 Tax=Oscillatoria sp. FACHB-1406 TaxID=2692846 RepID=UPI00168A08D9|nr:glycosyltransferase family 4 protein [Oscillatoria sp. FACHB-1406]MBD2579644.1 glycosyltransferase family 4 protein [Oscillatoria sp. FACHB-1406]
MKVSLLAPDLSGGGGTRVYLLGQVLQKLGCDVKVFGFLFGENLYPLPPSNLPVQWVRGRNYPQILAAARELLSILDGDVLYAVKPRPTSFGIGLLKRFFSRRPVVLDIDDWEMSWFGGDDWRYRPTPKQLARDVLKKDGALRNPQHPFYLQQIEQYVRRADAITADTKFLQQRYGGTYLPNGKDTDLFDPSRFNADACRAKYGLENVRVLMFPGTARPHKGLEDILAALDRLNQEDLKLVLVGGREIGDGYVESLLSQWPRWIVKLPSTPIDKMPEVVAAAHVVVVPQRENRTACAQFPIKLTDGMAMAKPIVATRVGDIPEILGDRGFLSDPSSPEQLADKIQWIFENLEAANAIGLQARQRCVERYSLKTMAEILAKILEGLTHR